MRWLSLDVGEKRIGLAVSDPLGIIPRPIGILKRKSNAADLAEIRRLVTELGVEGLVMGYPVHVSGEKGQAVQRVERMARRLKACLRLPILGVDERYTTLEAKDLLLEKQSGKGGEAFDDDALSAALILRRYLDEGENVVLAKW